MSEMKNFNKEFVERTRDILKRNYEIEKYEVTLLLNCLLGLVSFPIELLKDNGNRKAKKFQEDCVNKLKELIDRNEDYLNPEEDLTFRNIRNSIAHIGMEPHSHEKEIEKIMFISKDKITNKNLEKYNVQKYQIIKVSNKEYAITLKFYISVKNLYVFAKYVADEYLERFFLE